MPAPDLPELELGLELDEEPPEVDEPDEPESLPPVEELPELVFVRVAECIVPLDDPEPEPVPEAAATPPDPAATPPLPADAMVIIVLAVAGTPVAGTEAALSWVVTADGWVVTGRAVLAGCVVTGIG